MRPFCWRNGLSREIRRMTMKTGRNIFMFTIANPDRLASALWVSPLTTWERTPVRVANAFPRIFIRNDLRRFHFGSEGKSSKSVILHEICGIHRNQWKR
jgi:hypothetical protein